MAKEHNFLAAFNSLEEAENCRHQLRNAGFDIVQIDQLSEGPSAQDLNHEPLVEWGRYGYQPEVLDDKWTTSSSWQNEGLINGGEWLLTAVVSQIDGEKARKIIIESGGRL